MSFRHLRVRYWHVGWQNHDRWARAATFIAEFVVICLRDGFDAG